MSRHILVTIDPYETRAAVLDNGKVVEILLEIKDSEKIVGCIFKGRVANVVPGTQSAFVDIGLHKDAFVPLNGADAGGDEDELEDIFKTPIQEILKVGQDVILQVLKEPSPTKGPRSTLVLSFPGRYLVLTPTVDHIGISRRVTAETERERLRTIARKILPKGMGVIFRTAAEGLEEKELHADLFMLLKIWRRVEGKSRRVQPRTMVHRDIPLPLKMARDYFTDEVERFIIDSPEEYKNILDDCDFLTPLQRVSFEVHTDPVPLFETFGVDQEIEKALQSKVWLESGGYLFIERTEALTAIDVNSGRFSSKKGLEETVYKVNVEAATEIARQVRLRNLSGQIVIDFIDMENRKHRAGVIKALKEAFKGDRNRPNIVEMSDMGLVQMTRRRTRASLEEILKKTCPCCTGTKSVFTESSVGNMIRKKVIADAARYESKEVKITAHRTVLTFLRGKDDWRLKELEERVKRKVILEASTDEINFEQFKVEPVL